MHILKQIGLAVGILAGLATQSTACEVEHSLRFTMEGGSHNVRLNGVLIHRGIFANGVINLNEGLLQGENTVSVLYMTMTDKGAASYSIHKGCKGQLPGDTPIAQLSFDGEATKSMQFVTEQPVKAVYPGVKITDGKGLKAAVQALQEAVRTRDARAVLDMHDPLLANLKANGSSVRRVKAHVRRLIREGEIGIAPSFEMTPVMGGQAWEVRGPYGVPPVSIRLEADGGTYDWASGTLWVFVDGAWAVLEP